MNATRFPDLPKPSRTTVKHKTYQFVGQQPMFYNSFLFQKKQEHQNPHHESQTLDSSCFADHLWGYFCMESVFEVENIQILCCRAKIKNNVFSMFFLFFEQYHHFLINPCKGPYTGPTALHSLTIASLQPYDSLLWLHIASLQPSTRGPVTGALRGGPIFWGPPPEQMANGASWPDKSTTHKPDRSTSTGNCFSRQLIRRSDMAQPVSLRGPPKQETIKTKECIFLNCRLKMKDMTTTPLKKNFDLLICRGCVWEVLSRFRGYLCRIVREVFGTCFEGCWEILRGFQIV